MKLCKNCGQEKALDQFSTRFQRGKRGYQHQCKDCHSRYRKAHYEGNKAKYVGKAKEYNKARREELRKRKSETGCQDCGERHPACLDYHHLDEGLKDKTLVWYDCGRERMEAEIAKCIVLCSNCHRKRHWSE